MANLYELNKKIADFEFQIDEETGEILNADELDAIQMERDEKIENIALWVKNLSADIAAYKKEKEVFAEKERLATNKRERLKAYLADSLAGDKFSTARVSITWRKSQSVEVADRRALPKEFLKEQEPNVDKAGLKKALKAGAIIEGARLVEKQNLQIK